MIKSKFHFKGVNYEKNVFQKKSYIQNHNHIDEGEGCLCTNTKILILYQKKRCEIFLKDTDETFSYRIKTKLINGKLRSWYNFSQLYWT